HDPFVAGLHHRRKLVVGEDSRRRVHPPSGDQRVGRHSLWCLHGGGRCTFDGQLGSTSSSGCWRFTSVPVSARTRVTVPAMSDLISLKSFIASIRPTTWPPATSPPALTYGLAPGDGAVYHTPVSGAFTKRIPGPDIWLLLLAHASASQRGRMIVALCPPNPNALLIAVRMGTSRAMFGT